MSIRKRYTGVFKGKVALESVNGEKTLSELASHYEVHPNQIKNWKSYLVHHVGDIFENRIKKKDRDKEALIEELYKQIGQLKVELDWLKKKSGIICSR